MENYRADFEGLVSLFRGTRTLHLVDVFFCQSGLDAT